MRRFLATMMVLALSADAYAGVGAVKTMRQPLPAKEVERSLNMPKGWLEFDFGAQRKIGVGSWTADGEKHLFDSTQWTYDTARLDVRYGMSNRVEIWWSVPFHQARLTNELQGTDTKDASLGDAWFGYRLNLSRQDSPLSDLVFEAAYKGPMGQEAPGTYLGGPLNVSSFVFTTGTPDAKLGFAGKRQFGPIALSAHAGYMKRFSGVVQYLVELDNYQFSGRMKPGDVIYGDVGLLGQVGVFAVQAQPEFQQRFASRIGTTGPGLNPSSNLYEVEGSDGLSMDLRLTGTVNLTRGVDVSVMALLPMMGEDLQFFPLEDIHPTYGNTYGATLELRY
ncbi:MAG: hypothetical protein JXX28_02315 [Deltaproteobacteria bacterium]|nr:hypothetical protein [Deltaproteobacteria bacterium]